MKICIRCQQAIRPGEEYTSHDRFSASAGGATLYRHKGECPKR